VALVAQRVDVGHIEQARVLRAVRRVAAQATLGFDGCMFKDKRTARLSMALGADGVLIGGGLEVVVAKSAVGIVAVAALDQAFVDLVVEGHVEGRFYIRMALKTERRLGDFKQSCIGRRVMHRVTADATDIGLGVRRAKEVWMRVGMAAKAGLIDYLRRCCSQIDDLGLVSAGLDVRFARTMAALAGDAFAAMFQSQFGMGVGAELVAFIGMTGGAGIRSDEIRGVLRSGFLGGRVGRRRRWRGLTGCRNLQAWHCKDRHQA